MQKLNPQQKEGVGGEAHCFRSIRIIVGAPPFSEFPTGVENMGGLSLPIGGSSSKFDGGQLRSIHRGSMGGGT